MNLDEKLDDILKSNAAVQVDFDDASRRDYQTLIPQIRQAFTDAGYIDFSKYEKQFAEYEGIAENIEVEEMTGTEFYDRYIEQLEVLGVDGYALVGRSAWIAKEAAKRAAGLTDKDKETN